MNYIINVIIEYQNLWLKGKGKNGDRRKRESERGIASNRVEIEGKEERKEGKKKMREGVKKRGREKWNGERRNKDMRERGGEKKKENKRKCKMI